MRITQQNSQDGDTRLAIDGELDLASVGELHTAVAQALADGGLRRLVIDLADVTFCDSTGIRALIESRGHASDANVAMVITNAQDIVERVLRVTGVWDLLTVPADRA